MPPFSRSVRSAGLVAASITAAGTLGAILPAGADTPPGPQVPSCVWKEGGWRFGNTAYPDTSARYWVAPFTVQPGLRITVNGEYPRSRYASLSVYDAGHNAFTTGGVESALPDYRIAPDPGGVNPWQRHGRPAGRFTVTLREDVAKGQANTLPLAPEGTPEGALGEILFRSYLDSAPVQLPSVSFTRNGVTTTVQPCAASVPAASATAPGQTSPVATAAQPVVFNRGSGAGLYPNLDSAYLSARVQPPGPDKVVVIRAKAPRTVGGGRPQPWPTRKADLRYWSMCSEIVMAPYPVVANRLPDGNVDPGCRHDDQAALDKDGYYTFVVGTEAQRPAIERLREATFLPFSTDHPDTLHLFLLRNMVTGDFPHAVQSVPLGSPADVTARIMGDYYPRGAVCSLDDLQRDGAAACLAAAHA